MAIREGVIYWTDVEMVRGDGVEVQRAEGRCWLFLRETTVAG